MPDQPQTFWEVVTGDSLRQGDCLPRCFVPIAGNPEGDDEQITCEEFDLIIVTQSCDLANRKAPLVACCAIYAITDYEKHNPSLAQKGAWERVRKGQVEGLHLLSSFDKPTDNRDARVADFRQIYSLPVAYLTRKAAATENRQRLRSPYLEHFSQGFARFFMRVGLPSGIPEYR